MSHYLVAVHHSDGYETSATEDRAMSDAIDALNEEMVAAGIRVFVGGLHPPGSARALRRGPDGSITVEEGRCLRAGEHVAGFWVLEAASLDEATAWGRRAAIACRASIEVRPFH